ncbi:MAG: hypothetical protein LAT68_09265 [Cyclobacteriaceae bacterium]|nr:hypothetical protein [Cyclobacteriaceae bacterium]MCH8516504.1 hypothetical protein [Cyclobacteriaceae bacterium]
MKPKLIVSCLVFYTGCMVLFSCNVPEVDPDAERDARLLGTWEAQEVLENAGSAVVVFTEFGYHDAFGLSRLNNINNMLGANLIWSTEDNFQLITQQRRSQWGSGEMFINNYFFSGDTLIIDWDSSSDSQLIYKYLPAPFEIIYDEEGQFIEKRDR